MAGKESSHSTGHKPSLFHSKSNFFRTNSQIFLRPKFNSKYVENEESDVNLASKNRAPYNTVGSEHTESSTSPKSSRQSSYAAPSGQSPAKTTLKSLFKSSASSRRPSRRESSVLTLTPSSESMADSSESSIDDGLKTTDQESNNENILVNDSESKRSSHYGTRHSKSSFLLSNMMSNRSGSRANGSTSSSHTSPPIYISSSRNSSHESISGHHNNKYNSIPESPPMLSYTSDNDNADIESATNTLPSSYSGFHAVRFHGDQIVPPLTKPIKPRMRSGKRSTILKKLISLNHETMKRSSSSSDFFRRGSLQNADNLKFTSRTPDHELTERRAGSSSSTFGKNRARHNNALSGVLKTASPFGIDLDTEDEELAQITKFSNVPISRISSVNTVSSEMTGRNDSTSGWLAPESWKVKTDKNLLLDQDEDKSGTVDDLSDDFDSSSNNLTFYAETTNSDESRRNTASKVEGNYKKRHKVHRSNELRGASRSSVRIFKGEKSSVLPCTLETTCKDILDALRRKRFLRSEEDHIIVLKCGGLTRSLSYDERLLRIQRNMLFLYGYTERDNLDYIERTDLSFLFKFIVQERGVELISEDKRTLINPQNVVLRNWNIQDIPNFLYAEPIVSLDVSQNPSFRFTKEFMHDCRNMLTLKFTRSGHPSFPAAIAYAPRLTTLNLEVNYIRIIPPEISNLETLTTLDLACNRISHLPDSFAKLKNLSSLNLSSNRLKRIPDQVLAIGGLRRLDLSYNAITKISEKLTHLKELVVLQIAGNRLTDELPEFFEIFENLIKVDVRFNRLSSIDSLKNSPKLEVIRATGNNISVFRSSTPSLFEVEMNLNPLTYVYFESEMPNLKVVDLSKGKLTSCSFVAMLTGVEKLSLDINHLTTLPNEIDKMQKLVHLSVFKNNLNYLPSSVSKLRNLEYLDLHLNNLNKLTESIWLLPSLKYLNVSSNLLEGFPPVPSITEIEGKETSSISSGADAIDNNETITKASIRLDALSDTLKYLSMNDNNISDSVVHIIGKFKNLEYLNLSYNELYDIPLGPLANLHKLKALYLSGNFLSTLPVDDLDSFNDLRILHLNGNRFHSLPAELSKLKNLTALDVGSNNLKYNISNIPYDWNWCYNKKLQFLNFSGNKRLEIKPQFNRGETDEHLDSFIGLHDLHMLGLMDVTITTDAVPDQTVNVRVRSTSSQLGKFGYGISDTLGSREVLTTRDVVLEKFRGHSDEMLLTLYDAKNCSQSHGDKISKIIQETFGIHFSKELESFGKVMVPGSTPKTIEDCLRGAFLKMNSEMNILINRDTSSTFSSAAAHRTQTTDELSLEEDGYSGCCAVVVYIKGDMVYLANLGDTMGLLTKSNGEYEVITTKHEPYAPVEYDRIRQSGGYVTTDGYLDGVSEVSRAVGYFKLIPHITASPSIHKFKLTANEEMIAIATSDIWKKIPFDLAADIIRQEKSNPEVAAEKLRDFAISYNVSDKATAVVLSLRQFTTKVKHHERGTLPEDSILRKLDEEIEPPVGEVAMVFTDIKNSTLLWDTFPVAMRSAIKVHNSIMRRQMRIIGGYEVKTEGDAFMVSFPTPISALLWCFSVQQLLVNTDEWPAEILASDQGCEIKDEHQNVIFRGLSVRMGIHWGMPVCERDIVTRRMDYFGPMVNRASRVSAVADGGQITLSNDFYQEFQKLQKQHKQLKENKAKMTDLYASKALGQILEEQMNQLEQVGWADKLLGTKKLKGLEAPEMIWLIYPKPLKSRMRLLQSANGEINNNASRITTGGVTAANIWSLRQVSLRLERVCNFLASQDTVNDVIARDNYYQGVSEHAESALSSQMSKAENVTNVFFEHTLTRIENCVLTLSLREDVTDGCMEKCSVSELISQIHDLLIEYKRIKGAELGK